MIVKKTLCKERINFFSSSAVVVEVGEKSENASRQSLWFGMFHTFMYHAHADSRSALRTLYCCAAVNNRRSC